MAELRVEDVHKSYESGRPVLSGAGFTARDGEFIALLGPSGCGKTTLLRVIAGLETEDSGRIVIGGRDARGRSPKDRDVAFVFQSYALYPHMTVARNIGLSLELRRVSPAETAGRVRAAAATLGLEGLLGRKPAALSGGQRQRVALARALVRRPAVFLLDEPLSNLDAALRDRTRGELKLLFNRVRGTVVYVTHDQVEAMTMADRVVLLNEGRVQQDAPPEELYHRPANVFAAGFLGSPAMNVLPREAAAAAGLGEGLPPAAASAGVRPEDLAVSLAPAEGALEFEVTLAEPLGARTVLTLAREGAALRAVVPGNWPRDAGRAWARAPREALRFFDERGRSVA